jgi:hypothetical protein
MARVAGNNHIKAYYAYNQASFPRATLGHFYNLYKEKTYAKISCILQQVDRKFAVFNHARTCLWHTAIQYLLQEQQYQDTEAFSANLCSSLIPDKDQPDLYQQRQLNVDTSLTFFLLGSAQNSMGKFRGAMKSFRKCIDIRSVLVPDNVWDPTLVSTLEKVENLAERTGDFMTMENCKQGLSVMYDNMETNDLAK